jgi:ankyrin repeat protein
MSTDNVDTYSTVTSSELLFQECCQFQPNLKKIRKLIQKCYMSGDNINHQFEWKCPLQVTWLMSSLHVICFMGNVEILKLLLNENDSIAISTTTMIALNINLSSGYESNTPLHIACFQNHLTIVQILLQRSDININITNASARTPLHEICDVYHLLLLCYVGDRPLNRNELWAITRNDEEFFASKTLFDMSLLQSAYDKTSSILQLLLNFGKELDINTQDIRGNTPLHSLCYCINRCDSNMIRMLRQILSHPSININITKFNATPLDLARLRWNQKNHNCIEFFQLLESYPLHST